MDTEDFSWLPWWQRQSNNPNLNPVILVSGMGGSILEAVDEKGHRERVWVRILFAEHEFRSKILSLYNPNTGLTESLNKNIHIEVPCDNYGLYAISILDPSLLFEVFHVNVLYYYHDMINQMLQWGYEAGKTLFGFGYDFRQSSRVPEIMESLRVKLKEAYKASGGKKVNIVSHSMGGLLIKCFLALHPEDFERYVNNWIAIACPFQGAPAYAYEGLLTGIEFVTGIAAALFITKRTIRQLLVECPSIYELLCAQDYQWKNMPQLQVWMEEHNADGETCVELKSYEAQDSIFVLEQALENNSIEFSGNTIPLPFNRTIFQWSEETRKILRSAKLPRACKFYNIYGTSSDTASSICYGTKSSPVSNMQQILELEPQFTCVDGDGTIPVESAVADGLDAEMRLGIPLGHRDLLCKPAVFQAIRQWLEVDSISLDYDLLTDFRLLSSDKGLVHSSNEILNHKWDTVSEDSEDYNNDESFVEIVNSSEVFSHVEIEASISTRLTQEGERKLLKVKVDGKNLQQMSSTLAQTIALASVNAQKKPRG